MITSASNKRIKDIQKLKDNKNIKKYGRYLIEGKHLVEEALDAKVVEEIIISESFDEYNIVDSFEGDLIKVTDSVMKSISDTITTQGIIAVCRIDKKELDITKYSKVLILDKIQDPGNLGTIIRTADAAGFDAVVLGEGCVDLYNDKVVRSMQGSEFHVAIYHENLTDVYGKLKENDIPIAVTALHRDAKDFKWLTGRDSVAIVVGNEGNGVRDELIESADFIIQIPMFGQAESLNVAIATGVLMYQTRI